MAGVALRRAVVEVLVVPRGRACGGEGAGWKAVPRRGVDCNLESNTWLINPELGGEFCGFRRLHPVCLVVSLPRLLTPFLFLP